MNKEVNELSYLIIGRAMQVHRELGPGLDEIFYHQRLSELLHQVGVEHQFKPRRTLWHRGAVVDVFEPDMVVTPLLILELKCLSGSFAPANFVQLKAYLKVWQIRHGLIFDFGKESLAYKRYIFDDRIPDPIDIESLVRGAPPLMRNSRVCRVICEAVADLVAQFGLGLPDRTYYKLLEIELKAAGLGTVISPSATIRATGYCLGETKIPCIAIEGSWAVMVLSQREGIRSADRAIMQSWLRHLDHQCGAIVHFGKHAIELQWVLAPRARIVLPHDTP